MPFGFGGLNSLDDGLKHRALVIVEYPFEDSTKIIMGRIAESCKKSFRKGFFLENVPLSAIKVYGQKGKDKENEQRLKHQKDGAFYYHI